MDKKKKKQLPMLLGALLVLSFGAYGTRAYLTDQANTKGHISVELGTIDIEANDTSWIYQPIGIEGKINKELNGDLKVNEANITVSENLVLREVPHNGILSEDIRITNARPGDSFTRSITYKNVGTLTQNLNIKFSKEFFTGFTTVKRTQGSDSNNVVTLSSPVFDMKLIYEVNGEPAPELSEFPTSTYSVNPVWFQGITNKLATDKFVTIGATLTIKDDITQEELNSDPTLKKLLWNTDNHFVNATAKQTNAN